MSQQTELSFKVYYIKSNVTGHPAFALCTAYRAGNDLKAESFVVVHTSDTQTKCMVCKISISNDAGEDFPVVVDEAFALEQALRRSELDFSLYIHDRNVATSAPLPWPRWEFIEIEPRRLIGVWAYSPLRTQLVKVRDITECEPLRNYLGAFRSLPTISHSQTEL